MKYFRSKAVLVLCMITFSWAGCSPSSESPDETAEAPQTSQEAEQPQATGVIVGTVTDPDGDPVSQASIYFQDTKIGAASTEDGSYKILKAPAGQQTLICRAAGMEELTRTVTVQPSETDTVDLTLQLK